jgi:hypothetical protein
MDQETQITDHGSRVNLKNLRFYKDHGSKIKDHGSQTTDQSWDLELNFLEMKKL